MSRRRKLALAGCAIVAAIAILCWPRAQGPSYEGRTVEEWFKRYDELRNKGYCDAVRATPTSQQQTVTTNDLTLMESVFKRMGTNAVPYLAGISSGQELARPYLERGLKDSSSQVQEWAAYAIGSSGDHGKWAVSNLLELASSSPDFDTHQSALAALNTLGTNSWPVIPRLKEMLASEQDEKRRKSSPTPLITSQAPAHPRRGRSSGAGISPRRCDQWLSFRPNLRTSSRSLL